MIIGSNRNCPVVKSTQAAETVAMTYLVVS